MFNNELLITQSSKIAKLTKLLESSYEATFNKFY